MSDIKLNFPLYTKVTVKSTKYCKVYTYCTI